MAMSSKLTWYVKKILEGKDKKNIDINMFILTGNNYSQLSRIFLKSMPLRKNYRINMFNEAQIQLQQENLAIICMPKAVDIKSQHKADKDILAKHAKLQRIMLANTVRVRHKSSPV